MEINSTSNEDSMKFPKSLQWDFTQRCTRSCIYCHKKYLPRILNNGNDSAMTEEISIQLIEKIVKEIATRNTLLDITGGEPFLNKHIWELLSLCVNEGVKFAVITKKTFSEKDVVRLKNIGVNKITVSIDSPIADKADFLVGDDGFFAGMLSSIKTLKEYGIQVNVKSLICNYTINDFSELIELLDDQGVETVVLQDFMPGSFSISTKYVENIRHYTDILSLSDDNRSSLKNLVNGLPNRRIRVINSIADPDKLWEPTPCPIKVDRLFLRPDGKVFICGLMHEFVVGNIKEQSIAEIWNSEAMQTLKNPPRSLFEGTNCYDCHAFEECNKLSRCYEQALINHGRMFAPDEVRLCKYFLEDGSSELG